MSNKAIKIQLNLPPNDPSGDFITGNCKVKIRGVYYTTQSRGIIELSGDWRGKYIESLFVYNEKGDIEYSLKEKVYVGKHSDGLIKVVLKK